MPVPAIDADKRGDAYKKVKPVEGIDEQGRLGACWRSWYCSSRSAPLRDQPTKEHPTNQNSTLNTLASLKPL